MARFSLFMLIVGVLAFEHVRLDSQEASTRFSAQNTSDWQIEGAQARAADVRLAPFLDRSALWLRNGTQAIRTGVRMADGTIEFDVAPMDRGDFVAVVFRRESFADHENIYIRPRSSGEFMALQYAPRTRGSSTWQLYREFTARAAWPRNGWTHVRVEVRGSKLDVFVDNNQTPALSVPRLRHASASGEVAFWARVNDAPAEWAAALSNIDIRPDAHAVPLSAAPAPPPAMVSRWEVAGPLRATQPIVHAVPSGLNWTTVQPEETGLVNLNRLFRAQPQQGRFTAFLRTTVNAAAAGPVLAGLGYSDDVTMFVNGAPVYSGVNGWDTRTPEFVSFVDPRFERVWMPLRAGANEIVLAITDDQRFGWGGAMSLGGS